MKAIFTFICIAASPALLFAATQPLSQSPDTSHTLDEAKDAGSASTKLGGSTTFVNDDAASNASSEPNPSHRHDDAVTTAQKELRSGTTSTGGTGTTMSEAGNGSASNTSGTGAVGADSGQPVKQTK